MELCIATWPEIEVSVNIRCLQSLPYTLCNAHVCAPTGCDAGGGSHGRRYHAVPGTGGGVSVRSRHQEVSVTLQQVQQVSWKTSISGRWTENN